MIEYSRVSKVYGSGRAAITAVNDVSLTVEKGQLVVLLGPSGCGKTTLLRMTNRLEPISSGRIRIDGEDVRERDEVVLRQSIGYVIQQIGLFPNKTIAENVAVVPKLLGWPKQKRAERVDLLLEMMNLDPRLFRDRYPAELSGGQQQRVGVARGLAADPEVLLMDEPFGAVDPINREKIQDQFLELQAKLKKTIVFVSHDINEAVKMADRIAIMREGMLVQYDTPEVILTAPTNQFVADFVGADRALRMLGLERVGEAMAPRPRNVFPRETPSKEVLERLEEEGWDDAFMVDGDGRPTAYATREDLRRESGSLEDHAKRIPDRIETRTTLRDALSAMVLFNMASLPVVGESGEIVGLIDFPSIQKHVVLTCSKADEGN